MRAACLGLVLLVIGAAFSSPGSSPDPDVVFTCNSGSRVAVHLTDGDHNDLRRPVWLESRSVPLLARPRVSPDEVAAVRVFESRWPSRYAPRAWSGALAEKLIHLEVDSWEQRVILELRLTPAGIASLRQLSKNHNLALSQKGFSTESLAITVGEEVLFVGFLAESFDGPVLQAGPLNEAADFETVVRYLRARSRCAHAA
jgi:hypothetical protein